MQGLSKCIYTPFVDKNEAWIGATPEVLGQYDKNTEDFETMSLAGTLPVSEDWSEKKLRNKTCKYLYTICT